jgi:hypothetical protein
MKFSENCNFMCFKLCVKNDPLELFFNTFPYKRKQRKENESDHGTNLILPR